MTAYVLERAWVDGAVHDDVYVEIEGGRFAAVELGGRFPALAEASSGRQASGFPGSTGESSRAPRPHDPGPGELPQPRVPPGAEGADAAGARDVLDVAGADVRGGRAARPRLLPRAGHGDVPGDGRVGHHGRGGVPLPAPPGRRDAVRRPQRHGPRPPAGGPRRRPEDPAPRHGVPQQRLRRASASASSDGSATAPPTRGPSASRDLEDAGAAIHSVRAVPDDQLRTIVEAAAGKPLHVHLSEQTAENDACVAAYGATPTQLLADHGVLGPLTSAVHATHLTDDDIGHLGATRTFACFCPTTERDLGDGIGPSRRLHDAGSPLTLGSDSHAVIDLFEEMRAVELDERLATRERGHWSAAELLDAATIDGHASLGYDDAGAIAVGQPRRPGHPRHHHAPHRRHRPRRAHRRLRGHRRRRRPGRRRRQGRLHPGRRAGHRPRARRRDREALAVSTVITNIGELVTNDPQADDLLGIVTDAAVVLEGDRVAWTGPAADAPAADVHVDAGGRAVIPGFVDSHSHLVFAGDRAPEFAARMAGTPYAAGGIRTTVAATRAATDEQLTGRVAAPGRRDAAAGHDHGRDQERLRADRPRRGAQPGDRPAVHRRDHVPRRARGARGQRPRRVRRAGHRPDARGLRPARPLGRRVLRARRVRRGPGPRGPRGRRGKGPARTAARQPARPRTRASGWPPSSAWSRSTTAPTSTTPTSRPWPTAAPSPPCCPASSSRPASPTPTRGASSTPASPSRSPATATRAPATPPRCRCASPSRCGRWG